MLKRYFFSICVCAMPRVSSHTRSGMKGVNPVKTNKKRPFSHERHAVRKRLIIARKSTLIHEVSRQLAYNYDSAVCNVENQQQEHEATILKKKLLKCDGRCEYCEKRTAVTLDHFVPLVKNGRPTEFCNDTWNCIPCCKECNSSKGGRTYEEWFGSCSSMNPVTPAAKTRTNHGDTVSKNKSKWIKFAAYDTVFQVRCMRRRLLQQQWWNETNDMIHRFVNQLQERVDAYTQQNKQI